MSFLSSSRCVLILGDEGLQIYNVARLSAKLVDFVPWDTVDFEASVSDLIVKKCKRRPVVILSDMVEQHYRKERIPKVGMMDRANVLKRRVSVAFPNYKIRAALKLDDKKSNIPKDNKGAAYLFAAIPASDTFTKTMNAVSLSNANVVGFYLLPIEASLMVKTLSSKIDRKDRGRASWTIFMGQHHSGGVRQIVIRDGELALTRMTPIVDTDVEPELWAKEISTELNATMSYLARFGYKEADGLNVIIIANDNMQDALNTMISVECNLQILNAQEAAKLLNINIGQQSDLRYADPLHASYLGRKNKFRLPMQVTSIDSVKRVRQFASLVIVGLFALVSYFGYLAFSDWTKLIQVKEDIRISDERKKSVQQEYDLEIAKKKAIGFDFILVSNSVEQFELLTDEKMNPLELIKTIGFSLGADLKLDKIDLKPVNIKKPNQNNDVNYYGGDQVEQNNTLKIMQAVMTISFDSSVSPDIGVSKTNELKDRLRQQLPNYDVEVIKQVADLSYTGNFVGEAGGVSKDNVPQEFSSEISIRGPLR